MEGIINFLKPPGMSSADAVAFVKKTLNVSKVGHTGTLDPGVAGVLPICVGKATRIAEYLTVQGKGYRTEITLGKETTTQDIYGEIVRVSNQRVTKNEFQQALLQFTGEIEQIPPMYSAVHKNGKRLYEYAREGMTIERELRKAMINKLTLLDWETKDYPRAIFDVDCSKGTYVRTLCHDIGQVLGCGAFMSFLTRYRSGPFVIEDSWTMEEIEEHYKEKRFDFLLPLTHGLTLPKVILLEKRVKPFLSGLPSRIREIEALDYHNLEDNIQVQVVFNNELLGIGIISNDNLYPYKVLK